jgi:8-amino-7-oxononanoate synthase
MIARDKNMEAALVFPTGYQANATVLAALLDSKVLGARPLVFSDRLNHASIHHGCFLAGVKQFRYPNVDLEALESLLHKHKRSTHPKFILTESVFSMDGSSVDMDGMTRLAKANGAFLYVDEAHATGLYGKEGYGFTSDVDGVDVSMGTFSKALGVQGGYVACSKTVKHYLINKCTGFIYSTGTSPLLIGAIMAAWRLIPEIEHDRKTLLDNAKYLREHLNALGFNTGLSKTQIVPIIVGKINRATALKDYLLDKNMITSVIRPPTVPPHTARVRLCLNTQHTRADLMRLLDCLAEWKKNHG